MNKNLKTEKPYIPVHYKMIDGMNLYVGVPNFACTESLKCQSTLKRSRKKGFINRHIVESVFPSKFY